MSRSLDAAIPQLTACRFAISHFLSIAHRSAGAPEQIVEAIYLRYTKYLAIDNEIVCRKQPNVNYTRYNNLHKPCVEVCDTRRPTVTYSLIERRSLRSSSLSLTESSSLLASKPAVRTPSVLIPLIMSNVDSLTRLRPSFVELLPRGATSLTS